MQIGLGALLFVVFLVLKLTDVIDWSWLWVTAPLWIGAIIGLFFLALWGSFVARTTKEVRKFDKEFDERMDRLRNRRLR